MPYLTIFFNIFQKRGGASNPCIKIVSNLWGGGVNGFCVITKHHKSFTKIHIGFQHKRIKVIFIQLQEFPTPPHCCCCSVTKWSDSGIAEAFKWNIQCGCENASKQLFHLFIISNLRSEITHENWEDIIQKSFLNVTSAIMKEISGLQ